MAFPKCPECGADMTFEFFRYKDSGKVSRYWECVNSSWTRANGCQGRIDIDPKKEIPWTVIAKIEAQKNFWGSDHKRKEQTGLKRTITGIRTCKNDNARYLSQKEVKALDAAMQILDKFLTASKKTKDELIKLEALAKKEEEAKAAQREFEDGEKFLTGLDHEGLLEKCEILNLFDHRRKDQWLDHTDLMRLVKAHRDNPKNKKVYRQLLQKVGRILASNLWDQEDKDRFAQVEEEFLAEKEVQLRRDNLKIIE